MTIRGIIALAAFALGWVGSLPVRAQDDFLISGYGNVHYMDHDGMPRQMAQRNPDDGFIQLREFSLFFDFPINESIVASTEIEAGDNGNTYTANYAYVDIQARDDLNIRVGKVLVPFLSYNENKPNFRQSLMSAPFTAWNIAPVIGLAVDFRGFGWSDAGAVLNWYRPLGDAVLFDAKAALVNGLGSQSAVLDDNAIQLATGPHVRPRDGLQQNETQLVDNNNDKASVVKLSLKSLAWPLDAGLSWYRGAWDPAGEQNLQLLGFHLNYLAADWSFKAEYVTAAVEQEAGVDLVTAAGLPGPAPLNTSRGDYGMLAWYAEGAWTPLRRAGGCFLKLVARLDDLDTNDEVPFTPFDRRRLTLGAEYQFAPDARVRYELQLTTIDDFDKAPAPFVGAGGKEHIRMHMPSLIFSF